MKNSIWITIKKELRAISRDKKSALMMLLTPLMIPLLIFVFSFVYSDLNSETSNLSDKYSLGVNYEFNNVEKSFFGESNLDIKYFTTKEQFDKAYKEGKINAYILKEENNYKVYSNKKSEESLFVSNMAMVYLENYNKYLAQNYLINEGIDLDKVYNNIVYTEESLNGENDFVNLIISEAILFGIMSVTLTAVYSSTDSAAGEKERGTLETLLTFPIKSEDLVFGKYLAITIACVITSIVSLLFAGVSLIICINTFEIYKDVVLNINAFTIFFALIIMISYSFFISGASIAIASLTKSYKEAQSALTPLTFLSLLPMFLKIFNVKLTPLMSFIPVVSQSMLLEKIFFSNVALNDVINILIMFSTTVIYSILIVKLISKQYKSEKILFS